MKTYACGKCGNRMECQCFTGQLPCRECGTEMHILDGIVRGGGVMAIWLDGREVWSGTGLEAVELLADHLQFGGVQQVEADRIVRALASLYLPTSSGLELIGLLKAAVMHVTKYPKT